MSKKYLAFFAFLFLSQVGYAAAPPATPRPIPEPSMLSLYAIGIGCLLAFKKRK
jgi:hypothetical protein